MAKFIFLMSFLLLVSVCKGTHSDSKYQTVPPGCDAAAFAVHLQRKAEFKALEASLNTATRREPMPKGASVDQETLRGITLHRFSDGFVYVHAYFDIATRRTLIEVVSDALDACYAGNTYGVYAFSDEQMNQLRSALAQTKRLDEALPACTTEWRSNADRVELHYQDSTAASYIAKRTGSCFLPGEEAIPVISIEFFDLQSDLRKTVTDATSPYLELLSIQA